MFPRLGIQDDLIAYAGMLQKDIAATLGVSYIQLRRYVQRHNLRALFPEHGGQASWIARMGYTGREE